MKRYAFPDGERAILEGLQQPFAVYQFLDKQVITLLVSDGFCKLLGYADRNQAVWDMDHDMYKDTHPDDRQRVIDAALLFAAGGETYDAVFRTRAGVDSDYRVIHAHGKHVFTEAGIRLAYVWYMDEGLYIEGNESAGTWMNQELNSVLHEESILRAVNYDALTGLPNLGFFFKLCEINKARDANEGKQNCLLYIDLYGMKYYNHRNGFAEGDKLLKAVAEQLAGIFGLENCCHIGADRFSVYAVESGLIERLQSFLCSVEQMSSRLPVRVGIYSSGIEDVPISSAYDRAKVACDIIPKTEISAFRYYTRELSDAEKRRRYVQSNIEKAISEKWIKVYYQAIVRTVNEKVCDVEALARWVDPELGFLSPAEFIPDLEASGKIYKLDLYVLERVLETIRIEKENGLTVVPHSINLSRADFDSCDIVEEIRQRVDAAGVRRELITIEITESVIGSDLEYMKAQIERFRRLGFPVWMDDFGSGYSSLDVLQSIQFDLIKFDMSFMKKLNGGGSTQIVLTDLMKLAASLGVDTVCEGVETEEQVHFLQEIGCSKMQGFRYSRPLSLEAIQQKYTDGQLVGFEDPASSSYFESIGRINVYDLDVIASQEDSSLRTTFDTIPIGIIEVRGDKARFVRSNPSYREFVRRFFGFDIQKTQQQYTSYSSVFMNKIVKNCSEQDGRTIFNEKLADGSVVHCFARRISTNPQTGDIAIAVAILSVTEPTEVVVIDQLLSVIEQFGDHIPGGFFIYKADGSEELLYANQAVWNIFGCGSLKDFKAFTGYSFRGMVHPEDYAKAAAAIRKRKKGSKSGLDSVEYRIIRKDGETRWIDDYSHYMEADIYHGLYYAFISDITSKYRQAESAKALRSAVIEALAKAYDSVWLISDVKTQQFELYWIDREMVHLLPANIAVKLKKFYDAFTFYSKLVLEEDRQRFLDAVTPESILKNTENSLIYSVPFRRVFDSGIRYYRVEFARLELPGGKTGIVTGFKNVDEEVRKDQSIQQALNIRAAVIEAVTRPYDSVWLIRDLKTQRFELFRVGDNPVHLLPTQEALKMAKFYDAAVFYSKLVLEEDRQQFLDAVTPESILKNTESSSIYSVPFRRVFEEGIRNYRVEFVRMDLGDEEINIVAGFKDVDK
ncbi:MAG: EAL domain-containing protein [Clostridia bacterium]|nr:EAL domain-containing protein [Clostridia bacterium]